VLGVGLILGCPLLLLEDEREQDDHHDAQYRRPEGRMSCWSAPDERRTWANITFLHEY